MEKVSGLGSCLDVRAEDRTGSLEGHPRFWLGGQRNRVRSWSFAGGTESEGSADCPREQVGGGTGKWAYEVLPSAAHLTHGSFAQAAPSLVKSHRMPQGASLASPFHALCILHRFRQSFQKT